MQEEKRNEYIKTVSVIEPTVRETHTEALHLNPALGGEKNAPVALCYSHSVPLTHSRRL